MPTPTIAFFISPHGFGHATRAAAIMAATQERVPGIRFELFTTAPIHIFKDSLQSSFGYHALCTDVGMVQTSPLIENPEATCQQLDNWLPFTEPLVNHLASRLQALNCRMVVSDISPLGIIAGCQACRPVLLVENFTWDWIYQSYLPKSPGLQPHIDYLKAIFRKADHHIQPAPTCRPVAGAFQVAPISRKNRSKRHETRLRLKIPDEAKMVLVSMGGVPDTFDFLSYLPADLDTYIVIPGAGHVSSPHNNVILLPTHSEFFHPDLMQAADALIGKAGYSTVAEAYHAGIPFGYISRPTFPESARLIEFIQTHLPSKAIDAEDYLNGRWIKTLPGLCSAPRTPPAGENGADTVAEFILEKVLS